MLLAVNYSPQLTELLQEGAVDLDVIKCADWPEIVEPASQVAPIYVHFPLGVGDPGQSVPDWSAVQGWLARSTAPHINVHLCCHAAQWSDVAFDDVSPATCARMARQMAEGIAVVREALPGQSIVAENLPTVLGDLTNYPHPLASVHPITVREAILQADCGLLFDIDHARIAAHTLGMTLEAYVAELPMDRLQELHMTGVHQLESAHPQDHQPLQEADWEVFGWALDQIAVARWALPWVYAFEYGGIGPLFAWRSDKEALRTQVPRMAQMLRERGLR